MPAGYSGCAYWRFRLPYQKLTKLGSDRFNWMLTESGEKRVSFEEVRFASENCHLIHMQSPAGADAIELIAAYHSQGKGVMVDYDDYSFDLSPGNPRYAQLGTKECEVLDAKGDVAFKWVDGENGFDLQANLASHKTFIKCVQSADVVTVTTEHLADKFRKLGCKVAILPNSVDLDRWKALPRPPELDGQIRIGYFGGDSHFTDIQLFKTLIPRLCAKYPQVKFVIQAPLVPQWRDVFKDIPSSQIEWYPWTDLRYYAFFLATRHWDIGLIPLSTGQDKAFNLCKSSIKWMEFAAVGAASVAQNMLPYSADIKDGVTGMLANDEEEWFEKISLLIENRTMLCTIKDNALSEVRRNHNLDINCRKWDEAAKGVLESIGKWR